MRPFAVRPAGVASRDAQLDDVRAVLLASVFGGLLHQRGEIELHGSAVARRGRAVMLCDDSLDFSRGDEALVETNDSGDAAQGCERWPAPWRMKIRKGARAAPAKGRGVAKRIAKRAASGETAGMLEGLKAPLRRFRVYRGLRFAWHFATDPVFRRDHVMLVRRPGNMFQYRSITLPDRYPVLFSFLRDRLGGVERPRLLSFGCATGEEVLTLRAYFPAAAIHGIDVNAHNIAVCRAKLARAPDPKISFAVQDSAADEPAESYDAIFCLAVFQHQLLQNPKYETCERFLRFDAFEATLGGIARALKPGGYLAIRHANFRFADAACSANFRPVLRIVPDGLVHPRFGRDNRRLPSEQDSDVVFRKLPRMR